METIKPTANLRNIDKLTALWALSESGLGGILHTFQIPFSGFFLAAFAILIIKLIAFYSKNPFQNILKATFLVLLIKAAVSPQSPPFAYLAVAFQGLSGAIIFKIIRKQAYATYLHAIFSLMETAIQKLLVLWIFLGASFFQAFDDFSKGIFKNLNMDISSFSSVIMGFYLLIYFSWAIYIGYLSNHLPENLSKRQFKFENDESIAIDKIPLKKSSYLKKIVGPLLIISGVYLLALITHSEIFLKSFYRTLIILFIWWLINPFLRKGLKRLFDKQRNNYREDFSNIFSLLSITKSKIKPAFAMARKEVKGIKVYKEFVFNLMALSLKDD
ncbi:MAG: hypothetical protein KKG25_10390 [Bacteroidetes bacterium]|nr:hypothetical protein [Bacteroidota bacterium]MBU1485250.1 hypothetical protein [Bacteroidota bacterium]MBU2267788.1 hypothetical protein [Bacteroidota bacterium]MBU2375446.1 hypothetical protein [Bacteroidota bacterium]